MPYPNPRGSPRLPLLIATFVGALILACDTNPPTVPRLVPAVLSGRNNTTILAVNDGPLRFARLQPDSATVPIVLADTKLRGVARDAVVLQLRADSGLLSSVGADARVLVDVDGARTSYALSSLTDGVVVYRFAQSRAVTLHYSIERTIARTVQRGTFWLAQRTTAQVESTDAKWVPKPSTSPGVAMAVDPDSGCFVSEASGTCPNGTTYTIQPWAPGTASWFGVFQSDEGTSYQRPITITFSRPILEVTTRAGDPDFPGNKMEAVGVGTVVFQEPGVLDQYGFWADWKTLTGQTTQIILTPNDSDYVAYYMWVKESPPPCPPTGDPIADEKMFRDTMSTEYQLGVSEGLERFVWVYRDLATLNLVFRSDFGTNRDACSVFGTAPTPPAVAGLAALASAHTHIIPFNEAVGLRCPGVPMTATAGNGPSPQDYAKAKRSGVRMFIIDENELHILRNDSLFTYPWTRENGCR